MNKKMKNRIKDLWRAPLRFYMRKKLKNHGFSIISANCVGEQFRTPTINLIIPQFVTFAENLQHYLQVTPVEGEKTKEGYPVCMLEDISIIGVHYATCEMLMKDWVRRAKQSGGYPAVLQYLWRKNI